MWAGESLESSRAASRRGASSQGVTVFKEGWGAGVSRLLRGVRRKGGKSGAAGIEAGISSCREQEGAVVTMRAAAGGWGMVPVYACR